MAALSLVLASCGSGDTSSNLPAEDVPAGKVMYLVGMVHAVANGQRRQLAQGDEVAGMDVIETGADGEVQIRFAHNGAVWGLGMGKNRRVSTSAAWRAPKRAGGSVLGSKNTTNRTAAAGWESERQSGDTRATLLAPETGIRGSAPAPATPATHRDTLSQDYAAPTGTSLSTPRATIERSVFPGSAGAINDKDNQKREVDSGDEVLTSEDPMEPEQENVPSPTDSADDKVVRWNVAQARLNVKGATKNDKAKNSVHKKSNTGQFSDIEFQVTHGSIDDKDRMTLNGAVMTRLLGQQVCHLRGISANLKLEVQANGAVTIISTGTKEADSEQCFRAAFHGTTIDNLGLKESLRLLIRVSWPPQ